MCLETKQQLFGDKHDLKVQVKKLNLFSKTKMGRPSHKHHPGKKKGLAWCLLWVSVRLVVVQSAVTDPAIQEVQVNKLHGKFFFFLSFCLRNVARLRLWKWSQIRLTNYKFGRNSWVWFQTFLLWTGCGAETPPALAQLLLAVIIE